jgi:hypothetical protein
VKEPIVFLTVLVIMSLEVFMVVVQYLPQERIGGLSGVVDRRMAAIRNASHLLLLSEAFYLLSAISLLAILEIRNWK